MRFARRGLTAAASSWSVLSLSIPLVVGIGCDPSESPPVGDNGPPFIVIGLAAQQPVDPTLGMNVYLQARGGNYVGIVTDGCTHDVAALTGATESCVQVPYDSAQPLSLTLQPGGVPCVVQARLYWVCDCDASGGVPPAGPSALDWCEFEGTLVASVEAPFGTAVLSGLDASALPDIPSSAGDP
ncbi:MAG: hypothetical protein ABSC94_29840 [Polyangiaceae bacterium]|jgi:hypothetical protein